MLSALTHLSEALAAIHGTVRLGLEGNLGLAAAGSAGSGEELAGSAGSVLAGVTAGLAALGLILEAALGVEFLLTSGKDELLAALFALERLVLEHVWYLSLMICASDENLKTCKSRGSFDAGQKIICLTGFPR